MAAARRGAGGWIGRPRLQGAKDHGKSRRWQAARRQAAWRQASRGKKPGKGSKITGPLAGVTARHVVARIPWTGMD